MVLPGLDAAHHVVVIQGTERGEHLGIGHEPGPVEVVVEERPEGRGGPHVLSTEGKGPRPVEDAHHHPFRGQHRFVQVDLPVHQAPGDDELLNGIDAFFLNDEPPVVNVEHADDALGADHALADPGEEAVPAEVVHPVHVELARDEVVQEALGVVVVEDFDRRVEHAVHLLVEARHDERAHLLVVNAPDERVLEGMAEWAVAHVVQEDGQAGPTEFVFGDDDAFFPQGIEGLLHQEHGPEGVVEPVVDRPRVDQVAQAQLADAAQALHPRVIEDVGEVGVTDLDEAVDGVVEQLGAGGHGPKFGTFLCRDGRSTK